VEEDLVSIRAQRAYHGELAGRLRFGVAGFSASCEHNPCKSESETVAAELHGKRVSNFFQGKSLFFEEVAS
jgi:hypothetical protein